MSAISQQTVSKPLVLCHSRDIKLEEKVILNRFLNVLEFNYDIHSGKILAANAADLVTVDIRSTNNRTYLAQNLTDYKASDKSIIWLRDPGDVLSLPQSDSFKFVSEIKRFNTGASTRDELVNSLRQVRVPKVEGRFKRVIKKLLGCFLKLA